MKFDAMHAVLAIAFLVIGVSVWNAHKSKSMVFNAFDLLMENGRVSKIAVAFMLVLLVSTWVIVDQQINGKLTEGLFGLWLTAWVTPLVAKVVFAKTEPPGTTSTSTTTVRQEITEKAQS
jgi:hypothetical protein